MSGSEIIEKGKIHTQVRFSSFLSMLLKISKDWKVLVFCSGSPDYTTCCQDTADSTHLHVITMTLTGASVTWTDTMTKGMICYFPWVHQAGLHLGRCHALSSLIIMQHFY